MPWEKKEKFIQELAWRDYWQQIWKFEQNNIFQDLKQRQHPVRTHGIPIAILEGRTNIAAVDKAIQELYETGYMHNHMRMYVASICCNISQCHWLEPARWMYAHLLDGDLASNHLSWQWVAGSNSKKKYYANQENINRFFGGHQKNTFLDETYEALPHIETPDVLKPVNSFSIKMNLGNIASKSKILNEKTLVYTYYNLDPTWHEECNFQRVLLLEPALLNQFPISENCLQFALALSKNIPDIKVFIGSFSELKTIVHTSNIIFKEHPLNLHFSGTEEPREWMTTITGSYPSFFKFWKQVKKQLLNEKGN